MDRGIIYPGQVPLEADLLFAQRASMIGLSKLAAAVLGTGTVVNGLAVTQTTVPSMSVQVAAGEIYQVANLDATAYSSLAADTTHQVTKQGVNLDATLLALTAPGTVGFSVNYLIQATLTEADTTPVVLPYFNASNPATAYSGPANAGTTQNTRRSTVVTLSAKSGAAAATGTQTTPAPDAGNVGLAVVTVANGAATVVNANISAYPTAPIITPLLNGRLLNVQRFVASGTYTPTPGMTFVIVEGVGGGGGGGGTAATGAAQIALSQGGGAGSYAKGKFTATQIGASQSVTIGAAGTAASASSGGAGGASSLGALMSMPGGSGGASGVAQSNASTYALAGVAGGTAPTGGNLMSSTGAPSGPSVITPSTGGFGGNGGSSFLGAGAVGVAAANGAAAGGSGGGGAGCAAGVSTAALSGGAGAAGMLIVYEYA